jgi:hypothetical protein
MALERFWAALLTREPFSLREAVVCLLILAAGALEPPPSCALPAPRSPPCHRAPRAPLSTTIAPLADRTGS